MRSTIKINFYLIRILLLFLLFLNFLAHSVGTTLSGLEVDAINGSLWTLKNEVIFYAIVPLFFIVYKKCGGGGYFWC